MCSGFKHVKGGEVYLRNSDMSLASLINVTSWEVASVSICQRGLRDLETKQSASERESVRLQPKRASTGSVFLFTYYRIEAFIQTCLLLSKWTDKVNFQSFISK